MSHWCLFRRRLHEEWLERERLAQEEFRVKFEREETARKRKEEEEVAYSFSVHITDLTHEVLGSCFAPWMQDISKFRQSVKQLRFISTITRYVLSPMLLLIWKTKRKNETSCFCTFRQCGVKCIFARVSMTTWFEQVALRHANVFNLDIVINWTM